ncbi:DUF4259 domain-containing protein [Actinomadura sp. BRA 177]|uniref:DUF4259 domain-containing protein n=1 Tax=Actinomadura sp. BRA 177 TaxID=2745202 RepID=UPI0015961221|nr:DUF4259 domain-containing protein [Actinomadura sp. BRA 177]
MKFRNDNAADFAGDLDELALDERPTAIREALEAAIREASQMHGSEGAVAVAAVALVAAQCPDGPLMDSRPGRSRAGLGRRPASLPQVGAVCRPVCDVVEVAEEIVRCNEDLNARVRPGV